MKKYILNTPVLPSYGTYEFRQISLADAKAWVLTGGWVSAVGHQGTADVLSQLLDVTIPTNRIQISLQKGDEVLVFRLKTRLPEGVVLSADQLRDLPYDLALLKRVG